MRCTYAIVPENLIQDEDRANEMYLYNCSTKFVFTLYPMK